MIAIRTKTPVNIDFVDIFKKSIVEVELEQWRENKNGLFSEITYNKVVEKTENIQIGNEDGTVVTNEPHTFEIREQISKKTIQISIQEYNDLSTYCEQLFQQEMTYFEKQNLRKKVSLLHFVKNDFLKKINEETGELEATDKLIFGTTPEDWEIKE